MRTKRVIVVAGTDTDVGKTYVSKVLCKHLIDSGKKPLYIKPIQTGCQEYMDQKQIEEISSVDCETILKFKLPASPHLAAKQENQEINFLDLFMKIKSLIHSTDYDYYVIELAGGLLVPIDDKYYNADLIKKLDPGLIYLVSSPFLGTLNHTLMSLETLNSRGIDSKKTVITFSYSRDIESKSEKIIVEDNLLLLSKKNRIVEVKHNALKTNSEIQFYI